MVAWELSDFALMNATKGSRHHSFFWSRSTKEQRSKTSLFAPPPLLLKRAFEPCCVSTHLIMLRYAARESSAVAVRQSRSSRALNCQRKRFKSAVPSGNSARASRLASNEERADKPLSSLEIAFQRRLEQTRIQKQKKVAERKQVNGSADNGGLSANIRSMLREGSLQQQKRNNGPPNRLYQRNIRQQNQPQQGSNVNSGNGRFHRQQENTVQPYNVAQQLGIRRNNGFGNELSRPHGKNGAAQQAKSSAASIREMLAQKSTIGNARKSSVPSITDMLKGTASNAKQPKTKSTALSIRDMLVQTASSSYSEKKRDMTDISNLREAFLRTIEKHKEQRAQARQQNTPDAQNSQAPVQPAWRRDGAKGFRKRLQEQQREQMEKLEQQRKMRAAVNRSSGAFFMTQEDYIEEKRESQTHAVEDGKTIMLPLREATVTELSALFRVKIDKLLNMLKALGERPRAEDHLVDLDVMELLAMELGLEPVRSSRRRTKPDDDKNLLLQRRAGAEADSENEGAVAQAEAYDSLPPRPPVVCIMGHVDHGKTTLMDALRQKSKGNLVANTSAKKSKSKKGKKAQSANDDAVAGTEAGGITQVISAFQVPLDNQENAVTFLDTPGHAAFRAMRESGSNAADVIVLVVAADDGVSAQTVEIINFYKSIVKGAGGGGISMVVAMTKIDKHGIDINESRQRIENQLLEHGILSESFGSSGESEYGPPVQVIPVSGLTGEGLDDLIEGLVLQSEVMDLRADEKAQAEGIVMDTRMEKGVGVVADCIIRWGSLERGNIIVSGVHSGKVKALKDSKYSCVQCRFAGCLHL